MKLIAYLSEFVTALEAQLEYDGKRWGDTWRKRPVEATDKWPHQVDRAYARFLDYYDQWKAAGVPIPWLKITGECLIAWVRENHPEALERE